MTKKFKYNDEVNILELINYIWNNKFKLLLFVVFFVSITQIYLILRPEVKQTYTSSIKISPISIFEEAVYLKYNNYIDLISVAENKSTLRIENEVILLYENLIKQKQFTQINKSYLLKLFIEKFKERNFITKLISDYGLIKKNDFKNNEDYNRALVNLTKSIKIEEKLRKNNSSEWYIKINNLDDTSVALDFLLFAEKKTNEAVRDYIYNSFKESMAGQVEMIELEKDNIESLVKSLENENLNRINQIKISEKLTSLNKLKRLENIFNLTPIMNKNKFYSVNLNYDSTTYFAENSTIPKNKILFSVGFMGLIFGLIVIFFLNYVRKK